MFYYFSVGRPMVPVLSIEEEKVKPSSINVHKKLHQKGGKNWKIENFFSLCLSFLLFRLHLLFILSLHFFTHSGSTQMQIVKKRKREMKKQIINNNTYVNTVFLFFCLLNELDQVSRKLTKNITPFVLWGNNNSRVLINVYSILGLSFGKTNDSRIIPLRFVCDFLNNNNLKILPIIRTES